MFKSMKLKSEIKKRKKEIIAIEKRRYRSQANLVEAILKQETPDDEDVDYFNRYTSEIELLRNEIQSLQKELDAIEK